MTTCGRCGHERASHGGRCYEAIPSALGFHICTCPRFVSLGALIGVRILGVASWCVVVASLPALVDLIAGGGVQP